MYHFNHIVVCKCSNLDKDLILSRNNFVAERIQCTKNNYIPSDSLRLMLNGLILGGVILEYISVSTGGLEGSIGSGTGTLGGLAIGFTV